MYQRLLGHAQLYSSAAWLLSKNTNGLSFKQRERLIPSHILKAFSLELYFKVLLNLAEDNLSPEEKSNPESLVEIFRSLNGTLRQQMETTFSRILIGKQLPDAWPLDDSVKNKLPRDLEGNLVLWTELLNRFRQPSGLESEEEMPQVWFSREIEEVVRNTLSGLKSTGAMEKAVS